MIVKNIHPGGLADELGLVPGDELKSINGNRIRDGIDYTFHVYEADVLLRIGRSGETIEYDVEKDADEDLGVTFEDIQYRHCGSDCVFCFVDQNPPGVRPTLNFRDEDFRLSFLHGSYFTLNNVSKADLRRIIGQRLTPLYISVHALDPAVRAYLFGVKRNDRLLEKIQLLTDNGIELHTQIVLCPGINDGNVLQETISGLKTFFPGVRSVALVPVGLTKHRDGLEKLDPVTPAYARRMIAAIHRMQKPFLEEPGERFVYLSDEWYLLSGRRLPSLKHYGELYQLENGVGMTRQFIRDIQMQRKSLAGVLPKPKKIGLLTGTMAAPILREHVAPALEQVDGLSVEVSAVENTFYGSSIHVSGLLSGADFIREMRRRDADLFVLPPNCLNPDGLTLDDMTLDDMAEQSGRPVLHYSGMLSDIYDAAEAA